MLTGLTMRGCEPLHASRPKNVQSVLRNETQRLQAGAYSESHGLELDEALVLVRAELKVLPLLVDLLLLAIDHLLHLLGFLMDVHDAARANSLCVAKFARRVTQNVKDGLDAFLGRHLEALLGDQIAARYCLAIDFLHAFSLDSIWARSVGPSLGHQLLEILRHGGSCL